MKKIAVRFLIVLAYIIACLAISIDDPMSPPKTPTAIMPTRQIMIQSATVLPKSSPTPIVIPPTPTPTVLATMTAVETLDDLFYTVAKGETLSEISIKTDISIDNLVAFNNLTDANWIYEGQVLTLKADPEMRKMAMAEPGRKILVVLSEQKVYAYDDNELLNEFLASTGTWQHPTVIGRYPIWIKLESTTMSGPGYNLPGVRWTMYFYRGYGLHGTYWHNNFGTPMSHGCVNLTNDNAEWLYNFASVGTPVWVIP